MTESSKDIYFHRKRQRRFQYVIQGQFKQPLPFTTVYTGQAFSRTLVELPARWLLNVAVHMFARFQPGIEVDLLSSKPYMLSPLMSTCQNIGM